MSQSKILSIDSLLPQDLEEETDLIPLMTSDDEKANNKEPIPDELPILLSLIHISEPTRR